MPRPRHAQGRPGTRVIPLDWNTTHAPVVDRAARGQCALRAPAQEQEWNGTQVQTVPAAPYWTGPCRVQALSASTGARAVITVEDREFSADFLIVLPLMVDVSPGHLVDVLEQPESVSGADSQLMGLVLQVEHVVVGTERFERDVFCTLVR